VDHKPTWLATESLDGFQQNGEAQGEKEHAIYESGYNLSTMPPV
jgi:hypothetical protein